MATNRVNCSWVRPATALLFVFLVSLPLAVAAQDAEPSKVEVTETISTAKDEDLGERGAKIMGRLDLAIQNHRDFSARIPGSSEEDSLVLRLQKAKAQQEFMSAMVELGDLLTVARKKDNRQGLVTRGNTVFEAVTPLIWEQIGVLRTEIDNFRGQRSGTPPGERANLEDNVTRISRRLDSLYSFGWTHLQKLQEFGIESTTARDTFNLLLEDRAREVSGRLDLAALRIKEFNSQLKEQPGDADLTLLRSAASKSLDNNIASQTVVLDLMDKAGRPTENYRAQLVTMTQDLASGILDAKVAARLTRQAWNGVRVWTIENGPAFLVKLLLFLVIVIAGRFLANLVSKLVEKSLDRAKLNMSHLLKRMTVTFAKNAIIVLALVFGLAQLGLSLGPLLAGFGVIGFILGFAMQDSLSNLAAGMMILINRPYDVGDLVEISGVFGKVEQMSMVSTSILTLDNQKLVVPNSKIWGDVIKNVTDQRVRRIDMVFGISYTDDIPHAEMVLNDILKSHVKVLDDPEPMVRLHTLNDSSVDFVVRPWVKTDDYWEIYWDVTRAVKMRFDEEDISIPFPQRDVHFYEQKRLPAGKGGALREVVEQGPVAETGRDAPGDD